MKLQCYCTIPPHVCQTDGLEMLQLSSEKRMLLQYAQFWTTFSYNMPNACSCRQ